jgi:hypothetical protein
VAIEETNMFAAVTDLKNGLYKESKKLNVNLK